MSKKKKRTQPVRISGKAPDDRPFFKKMVSHYANNPVLFFGILAAAFLVTLALTQGA